MLPGLYCMCEDELPVLPLLLLPPLALLEQALLELRGRQLPLATLLEVAGAEEVVALLKVAL